MLWDGWCIYSGVVKVMKRKWRKCDCKSFLILVIQARAKLPKKRRRVLPVETVRPPHHPGVPPVMGAGPGAGLPPARRMNAIKQNNPTKDILSTPKMGM